MPSETSHFFTTIESCSPIPAKLRKAILAVIEPLEARRLLSGLTVAQIDHVWTHLKPGFRQLLAVEEYVDPQFRAWIDAQLQSYGLPLVAPEAGTISFSSDAARAKLHHRPPRHRLPHHKPHHHHHGKDGPQPPTVTNATYYYDQALPNQVAFTFDEGVTSTNWNSAVTVLDLNTGATIPVSGTYSSALDTIVYNLNNNNELPDGNFAAILHGSQITDTTTNSLHVVGSDGVAGHDFFKNFYFFASDLNISDGDRHVGFDDFSELAANYNVSGYFTYSQGDENYDGHVNFWDYSDMSAKYGTSLPLLGTPGAPTAYIASSSALDIFWNAPTDTLVTSFDLYRDSTLLASGVTDTGFLDTGLSTNTTYGYMIVGKDANHDSSWPSTEVVAAIAPATPTLSLSGDAGVTEGDTYYLGGAFATANNDEPSQWNIAWGDGQSATYSGFADAVLDSNDQIGGPAGAGHTYATPGTYTITGSALSDIGTYAANSVVVAVTDATPGFSVLGDQTMVQGQPYTISASFIDVDSQAAWSVSWGDGATASSGTGSIPATLVHTFTSGVSAPFTINAVVSTDDGTYTNSTTVDEAMPTLAVTGAASVVQDATYTLTDSFSDPAGQSATGWQIAWGDGATSTVSGSASSITHAYTQALAGGGAYTIAAYAADADGTYYAAPAQVTVIPATPTVSLVENNPVTAGIGANITNVSTNPGNNTIQGWTIAWGDGNSSYFANNPSTFNHTYALPGAYTIAATARAQSGNAGGTLNLAAAYNLSVAGDATVNFSPPYAVQNQSYWVNVGFTDSSTAETVTGYTISWGDGTTSAYGTNPDYGGIFQHVYHTYGTMTLRAEVDTISGTYGRTATIDVQPNLSFGINGPFDDESGVAFNVLVHYDGTDPVPTYTMDWGDGSSTTSTARSLSHAYTFDPHWPITSYTYTFNDRPYTLTATEGGQTQIVSSDIAVYPGSGGVFTPTLIGSAIEGEEVAVSGTFTDSEQYGAYSPGATYYKDWGDWGGAQDEESFAHLYALAGTYTVQWDAAYQDNTSPRTGNYSQPFVDLVQQQIVVQHATPTVGLYTLVGGQDCRLQPTLITDSGETPQQWTISWGDGKSSISYGPYVYFTHHYQSPGNYSVDASVVTNEGAYSATATAAIAGSTPTVSIAQFSGGTIGAAYEQSQSADYLVVSRSAASGQPLTVNFSTGGTATSNEYELTDAQTGQILTHSVTIPANASFATIAVTAVEDWTPAWTDTLAITLGAGAPYTVNPTASTTVTEIVNDDLGVTLGDGSGNIVLNGSSDGKQDLVPLVLKFPQEMKSGAVLTLTDSADTEADVWATGNPGQNDHPILGNVDGTYTSSVAWTYGTSTLPGTTLWVGGTDGSASMNDIDFTLSGSDANATTAPTHPTTESTNSNPGGVVTVRIKMENDPNNSGDLGSDISINGHNSHNWLVGQMVDVLAVVSGPLSAVRNATFTWTTPPGTVLRLYNVGFYTVGGANPGRVSLGNDDGGYSDGSGVRTHTGLRLPELKFFWVAPPNPVTAPISVTVGNVLGLSGSEATKTTTYTVQLPAITVGQIYAGTPAVFNDPGGKWHVQASNPYSGRQGFELPVSVQMPNWSPAGAVGSWAFAQTLDSNDNIALGLSNWHAPMNTVLSLDGGEPFPWPAINIFDPAGHSPPSNILSTGATVYKLVDTPADVLSDQFPLPGYDTNIDHYSRYDQYTDYVMFLPPGRSSQWVPVSVATWSWNVDVIKNLDNNQSPPLGNWQFRSSAPVTYTTPNAPTAEPTWSQLWRLDHWTP